MMLGKLLSDRTAALSTIVESGASIDVSTKTQADILNSDSMIRSVGLETLDSCGIYIHNIYRYNIQNNNNNNINSIITYNFHDL